MARSKRPARRVKTLRKKALATETSESARFRVFHAIKALEKRGLDPTPQAIAKRVGLAAKHVGILLYHLRREGRIPKVPMDQANDQAAHAAAAMAAETAGTSAANLTRLTQIRAGLLDQLAAIDLVLDLLR